MNRIMVFQMIILKRKTFDLYGNEIKSISPGSIYINKGKKYIQSD